jgi:hypothetical protein
MERVTVIARLKEGRAEGSAELFRDVVHPAAPSEVSTAVAPSAAAPTAAPKERQWTSV